MSVFTIKLVSNQVPRLRAVVDQFDIDLANFDAFN